MRKLCVKNDWKQCVPENASKTRKNISFFYVQNINKKKHLLFPLRLESVHSFGLETGLNSSPQADAADVATLKGQNPIWWIYLYLGRRSS